MRTTEFIEKAAGFYFESWPANMVAGLSALAVLSLKEGDFGAATVTFLAVLGILRPIIGGVSDIVTRMQNFNK